MPLTLHVMGLFTNCTLFLFPCLALVHRGNLRRTGPIPIWRDAHPTIHPPDAHPNAAKLMTAHIYSPATLLGTAY